MIYCSEKEDMKNIKKLVLSINICFVFGCSTVHKEEREPTSINAAQRDAKRIEIFDLSTINSKDVRYKQYNLNKEEELNQLEQDLTSFLDEQKRQKDLQPESKEKQFVESYETEKPYNEFNIADGSLKDAFKFALKLIEQVHAGKNVLEAKLQIAQIARAIQLKYTPPLRTNFELLQLPIYLQYFSSPRVSMNSMVEDDPELMFVRNQLVQEVDFSNTNFIDHLKFQGIPSSCQYLKAKKGYGAHAGFQITCGKEDYKIKFGSNNHTSLGNERYSGPFNTRVYRSLGYLAPHINYFEELSVDYDRNVITEFNSRALEYFSFSIIGIPVYTTNNKNFIDPFLFMSGVKLKDGSFVDAKTARKKLLPSLVEISAKASTKETKTLSITDDMINTEFESQISQCVFPHTTLTLKDDKEMGDEVGPWMPNDLIYGDLKEVRGMMVLAAWSGNFDIRKDNLRLNLVKNKTSGEKELRLLFGDSGSGLGKAFVIGKTSSEINDMFWTVSKRQKTQVGRSEQTTLSLYGIRNLEPSSAFNNIKMSDAQWMLSKICRFSKNQIQDMLITSGLSSAEVALATAKLLERRNQMISDFNMEDQLKQSCFVPVNQNISYDPRQDGEMSGYSDKLKAKISAPFRNQIVKDGKVVSVK